LQWQRRLERSVVLSLWLWLCGWYRMNTYIYIYIDICIHISLWAKHRYQERTHVFSLNWIFDEYSKSTLLASLNQFIGPVYGNFAYDEETPSSLPRTNTT
jgi:hypothetical protein